MLCSMALTLACTCPGPGPSEAEVDPSLCSERLVEAADLVQQDADERKRRDCVGVLSADFGLVDAYRLL